MEQLEPIYVSATMQIVITPEARDIHLIAENTREIKNTLAKQNEKLDTIINRVMNDIDSIDSLEVLEDIRYKLDVHILEQTVEWTVLSVLAEKKGLTKDAIRKQLQNGDFEEGVDFKRDGNKIIVHQGAIGRLHRQRRSSNGQVL